MKLGDINRSLSQSTFTLSVFETDNHIYLTGASLEMSRSYSSLQLCLEYCLYERATGVKPVLDQSPYY